jgi:hypothetical protein
MENQNPRGGDSETNRETSPSYLSLPMTVKFARAVIRHWGSIVTSGAIIGALEIWQSTGHFVPHWAYWAVAAVGLVVAFYRAWLDEHQRVVSLKQRLDSENVGRQESEKRELVQVVW